MFVALCCPMCVGTCQSCDIAMVAEFWWGTLGRYTTHEW
jgi:hypothetical protein